MKIWQKYLLSKLFKTFLFLLLCLFGVYVIVDLSAHGIRFFSKTTISAVIFYYLNTFSTLLDLFFSLTFLLATLRVLFDLNGNREIVALQVAGISQKKLLFPFFFFAIVLGTISYINCQWLIPYSAEQSSHFKTAYKSKKKQKNAKLYTIALEDQSELVYKSFHPDKKQLSDVFWIRTPTDIWHMKTFLINSLEGEYVSHLERNSSFQFEKTESFPKRNFIELLLGSDLVLDRFIPYETRPLSSLLAQALARPADARIVFSHLYYKLLSPLIPLIVLIGIGPFAIRYSRIKPTFLIASLSIFCLLGLKTILDGMLILGENQVLPSYIAIFSPIAFALSLTLPNFVRIG